MKPILFNGDMVRAILDGRKTQTRRVMKPQPNPITNGPVDHLKIYTSGWMEGESAPKYVLEKCPYGQPGDLLYVKEAFAKNISGCPNGITYRADHVNPRGDGPVNPIKWTSARFMPRSASRITLRIIDVRVQRVQEIGESDAMSEGVVSKFDGQKYFPIGYVFKELWDSINAKRGFGWDVDPWVWCISFEHVKQSQSGGGNDGR